MPVTYNDFNISFKNDYMIYEKIIKCTIKDYEFEYSYNPTLIQSGSTSLLKDFTTGSFSPYATTVGLYNDRNELLAVAKFSQPLPISRNVDTNIVIKMDM